MNGVTQNQKHERARALVLLVVGAALSGVPLLVSAWIQTGAQKNQNERARQLDAVKAYLRTCNQFNLDRRRLLTALDDSIISGKDAPLQIAAEARAHGLEYDLQIKIVNLAFGEHIEPPSSSSPPLPSLSGQTTERILETWRKAVADRKSEIERGEQDCEDNAKRLFEVVGAQGSK